MEVLKQDSSATWFQMLIIFWQNLIIVLISPLGYAYLLQMKTKVYQIDHILKWV